MTNPKIINFEGEQWKVLSMGISFNDKTYCHLANTVRGRHQKNGFYPVQICCFVDDAVLIDPITEYYTDRANSGNAALCKS